MVVYTMDDETLDLVSRSAEQFTALLRSGVRPDTQATPKWTFRDVAAHAAGTGPAYRGIVQGGGSPIPAMTQVAAVNRAARSGESLQSNWSNADLFGNGAALHPPAARRAAAGVVGCPLVSCAPPAHPSLR
jgi:hypothetical protein